MSFDNHVDDASKTEVEDSENKQIQEQKDSTLLLNPFGEREFNERKLKEIETKLPQFISNNEMKFLLTMKSENIQIQSPTGKRGKNWAYFDEIMCRGQNDLVWSKSNYAICKRCFSERKFFIYATVLQSGKSAGTKNLSNHIESHEKLTDGQLDQQKASTSGAQQKITKHLIREGTLPNHVKEKITYATTVGLSIGNRPFNMLNDYGLKLIMKSVQVATKEFGGLFDLDQALCCPSTAARQLQLIYADGLIELKSILSKAEIFGLSITSDHWKGANKKYFLSFTISYADMEKEIVTTRYLALEFVEDKKNATTEKQTKKIIEDFKLNNFEFCFTTDNAMVGAYSNFTDKHNCCLAHSLALFQQKAFYNSKNKSKQKTPTEVIEKISKIFSSEFFEQKVKKKFDKQYAPFFDRLDGEAKAELTEAIRTIMIAKFLVRYVNHAGLEENFSKRLQQECETRWDTTCDMLQSITDIENELKNFNSTKGHACKIISLINFDYMKKFQDFLMIFKTARLSLSKQTQPTMVYALATCYRLYGEISDSPLFQASKSILMEIFNKDVLCRLNDNHLCAAAFSPISLLILRSPIMKHFKLTQSKIEKIKEKLVKLEPRLEKIDINEKPENFTNKITKKHQSMHSLILPRNCTISDLVQNSAIKSGENSIVAEFDEYLEELQDIVNANCDNVSGEENLFKIWKNLKKKFPKLYLVSTIFLGMQPTQTISERIFKKSKIMINSMSNRIQVETVNQKLFINHNPDLFVIKALTKLGLNSDMKFYENIVKEVENKMQKEVYESKEKNDNGFSSDEIEIETQKESSNLN